MSAVPVEVWAPEATLVELETGGRRIPMAAEGSGGWWQHPPGLPSGTDYAFVVDGRGPFPDPRSAHQPHGVHGPSRTFDTTAHDWRDTGWPGRDVRGAVLYELHIGTFTPAGTLDAAIEKLDHLAEVGVDVVELMPLAAFPGERGWGYDGVAPYSVHEVYGGPAALQRFVDAAHRRGLAVALDVVYNHLGPSGNYLGQLGPYFTDAYETPWGSAVNLDQEGSGEVRAYLLENALRWLRDFHLDALRLDAVHELRDGSATHVLAELSVAVADLARERGRPLGLIAESDLNDVTMVTPVAGGGLGMSAQWDDDVHHALHAFLTGERHGYYEDFGSMTVLAKAFRDVFVHDGEWSTFRGQEWGAPVPPEVDRRRFVASTSTHDQVGNRGLGDRPTETLTPGQTAIGAALLLTGPFTPMLFMGEEWAARTPFRYVTDMEPELGEAIREGRQEEFGAHGWEEIYGGEVEVPDPQDPGTLRASRLDWAERMDPEHARHLTWVRRLIGLRREVPDLRDGAASSVEVDFDEAAGWFLLRRGRYAVVVNAAEEPQTVPLAERDAGAHVLASWEPRPGGSPPGDDAESIDATTAGITLAGHDVAIIGPPAESTT